MCWVIISRGEDNICAESSSAEVRTTYVLSHHQRRWGQHMCWVYISGGEEKICAESSSAEVRPAYVLSHHQREWGQRMCWVMCWVIICGCEANILTDNAHDFVTVPGPMYIVQGRLWTALLFLTLCTGKALLCNCSWPYVQGRLWTLLPLLLGSSPLSSMSTTMWTITTTTTTTWTSTPWTPATLWRTSIPTMQTRSEGSTNFLYFL